jgi:hypothetical protein
MPAAHNTLLRKKLSKFSRSIYLTWKATQWALTLFPAAAVIKKTLGPDHLLQNMSFLVPPSASSPNSISLSFFVRTIIPYAHVQQTTLLSCLLLSVHYIPLSISSFHGQERPNRPTERDRER